MKVLLYSSENDFGIEILNPHNLRKSRTSIFTLKKNLT
jgi:hypothetical protein